MKTANLILILIMGHFNVSLAIASDNSASKSIEAKLLESDHKIQSDLDSSIIYGEEALKASLEIADSFLIARSHLALGYAYSQKGAYQTSLDHHEKSRAIFHDLGDLKNEARSRNGLGLNHYYKGNYVDAIEEYMLALEILESENDLDGLGALYLNISSIYNALEQYEDDLEYTKKAAETYKELGRDWEYAISLNNLADTYNSLGEYDMAIRYLNKSIEIKERIDAFNSAAYSYATMYESYELSGSPEKGKKYLDRAFDLFHETGSRHGLIAINQLLASYHFTRNEVDQAIEYGLLAYLIAVESEMKREQMTISDDLANFYLANGNKEKARVCQERHFKLKEAIIGKQISGEILSMQIAFELSKKEKALKQDERLPGNSLLSAKVTQINTVSLVLISLLAIFQVLGLFYYFRKKRT